MSRWIDSSVVSASGPVNLTLLPCMGVAARANSVVPRLPNLRTRSLWTLICRVEVFVVAKTSWRFRGLLAV